MTLIAIVAALLVTTLGAVHVAWAVSHLRERSRLSLVERTSETR